MSRASGLHRKRRIAPEISWDNPRALAICDGCGFLVNHDTLRKHMQYRGGTVPVWDGFLVCGECDDVPNPYFSELILAPDPVPVLMPRPDTDNGVNSYGYLVTGGGNYLVTTDDTWDWGWLITLPQPQV